MLMILYNFYMLLFKKGLPIWTYVVIAVIPIILFILFMIIGIKGITVSKQFSVDLSNDIAYGIQNNCIKAEYEDNSTRINTKNADAIYKEILQNRINVYKEDIKNQEGLHINFGNGNNLWIYPYEEETILIKYAKLGEEEKVFISTQITMIITYVRLTSVEWGNSPWDK